MTSLGILFVHNGATRFVVLDLSLLRSRYRVTELFFANIKNVNPLAIMAQVRKHDLVFGWFASWHTFLPMLFAKMLGKPSLLVIGGYDLANMPEIGYGHQRGGLKKRISRWTMHLATSLVTNAYYSQEEAERNAGIPKEQVHVVYHGVPDLFGSFPDEERAPLALTVGNVDRANLWRKGHEPFVRAAALLPDVEFVLVGGWKDDAIDYLRSIASPNVHFTGRVSDEELLDYYRGAAVYVQASAHEGFGMSVAEAMLAGCIPVVTRRGSLPEVVGDAGVYVKSNQPESIAHGIEQAMLSNSSARLEARNRILTHFPLERRREGLIRVIQFVLEASR